MTETRLSLQGQYLAHLLQQAPAATLVDPGEFLRADYTRRHLLLRTSIERFLRRNMSLQHPHTTARLARKLIIDLTNAGHLAEPPPKETRKAINYFINQYANFYRAATAYNGINPKTAAGWTYQTTSVVIEHLLRPQEPNDAFTTFAYQHYVSAINRRDFGNPPDDQFEPSVFCAMQQAIFNADKATTLSAWLSLKSSRDQSLGSYIHACQAIDSAFASPLTNKVSRLINRYGAPIRALRELTGRQPDIDIQDRTAFLTELEQSIEQQYDATQQRLIHSITRTTILTIVAEMIAIVLFIVPFDLLFFEHVSFAPLSLALLIPAVYIMSATYSLRRPSVRNTKTIIDVVERIVYASHSPITYKVHTPIPQKNRQILSIVYAVSIVGISGLLGWTLARIGFTPLHSVVFFSFLLAAGLLRFRIVQAAREVEVVDRQQTVVGALGDVFYIPFVHIGQWLSDSYRRINTYAYLVDRAIEMPIRTAFSALKTWIDFLRAKRDEA